MSDYVNYGGPSYFWIIEGDGLDVALRETRKADELHGIVSSVLEGAVVSISDPETYTHAMYELGLVNPNKDWREQVRYYNTELQREAVIV